MDSHGKTVLITGASRGIGAALAAAFAKAGYSFVGINYVNDAEAAESTAQKVKAAGAKALVIKANVGIRPEAEYLLAEFIRQAGRIDVLINNAGGAAKIPEGGFEEMPMDYWDSQIALNLSAMAYTAHKAVGDMIKKGIKGKIINISSIHGRITWVKRKMLPYAAAKGGVEMLTKVLSVEAIKHGIHVNAIAPGFIQTKLTTRYKPEEIEGFRRKIPLGELGQVEDITPLALFLADDRSVHFIVGQTFVVDGGQSIDGAIDCMLE
jgi:NAD(P)-dependent dehydrogenase (short-subunit alcohol dehydrogenase family)